MVRHPNASTSVGVEGAGFVMWFDGKPIAKTDVNDHESVKISGAEVIAAPREVWPGIEDNIRELERLLR